MSLLDVAKEPYRNYFVISNRANRKEFILFSVLQTLATTVYSLASGLDAINYISSAVATLITFPLVMFCILSIIPSFTLTVRRLHDIGRSGWWLLLVFLPIIGVIALLFMGLFRGDRHPNQYGNVPSI